MPFPSTLSSFNYPSASDRLNNPSHSALENSQSSAIGQIETIIGRSGDNSVLGTIIGDLRSPGSDGGGHIQTANKGGTGQTAYTKGDLLVATSSSVLSKFAIGADNQVLMVNTSVATGLQWGVPGVNKIANSASFVSLCISSNIGVLGPQSIMSASVIGGTLGTTGAVRTRLFVSDLVTDANYPSVLLNAHYGNTTIASVLLTQGPIQASMVGVIEYDLIANKLTNSQKGILSVSLRSPTPSITASSEFTAGIYTTVIGTATVDSTLPAVIGFTVISGKGAFNTSFMNIHGYTSEKIV